MNTATRSFSRGTVLTWGKSQFWRWTLTRQTVGVILLSLAVLASALSVIYVKAAQRNLYSTLEASQQAHQQLKVQWSQLLLEQNTWAAPARIQALAQKSLKMKIPQIKDTILLTQFADQ